MDRSDTDMYRSIETAPKNGTLVALLVEFKDNPLDETDAPVWTVGFSTNGDWTPDDTYILGWDWTNDQFTNATATILGWMPFNPARRGNAPPY